jgi:hypothetical protein
MLGGDRRRDLRAFTGTGLWRAVRACLRHTYLLCGRRPSDPHHLRFALAHALGRKVSDEFTVPLCRTHQLRQ